MAARRRTVATQTSPVRRPSGSVHPTRPEATGDAPVVFAPDAILLLILVLAPSIAGYQEVAPALALGGLACIGLALEAWNRRLTLPRHPLPIVAFAAIATLSLVSSTTPGATLLESTRVVGVTAVLCLTASIAARGGETRVVTGLLFGALIAGTIGLREYIEHARSGAASWRVFGAFTNPNFLAGYLAPALILALGLAQGRDDTFRPALRVFVVGLVVAVLASCTALTGSRGGFLALGGGVVVFGIAGLLSGALRDRGNLGKVTILIAAAILAAGFSLTPLRNRKSDHSRTPLPKELRSGPLFSGEDDSGRFRILTWQGSARMAMARPILGWGAGTFETAFAPFAIAGFTRHAHQGYLQIAAEGGSLWLLSLAALMGSAALAGVQRVRSQHSILSAAILGSAAVLVSHNLLDSLLSVPAISLLTWTVFGMTLQGTELAPIRLQRRVIPGGILAAAFCLVLASGRYALASAREISRRSPSIAVDRLQLARLILPWDYQVASLEASVNRSLHRDRVALEAAERAVALARRRAPGYHALAGIRMGLGDARGAEAALREGLALCPHETVILFELATLLDRSGRRAEALEVYRQLKDVEESPTGKVRAVAEYRDYRFAIARVELAKDADRRGDAQESLSLRQGAATILGERRLIQEVSTLSYLVVGDFDRGQESALRDLEVELWTRLASEFRKSGKVELASSCEEMARSAREGMKNLREVFDEIGRTQ